MAFNFVSLKFSGMMFLILLIVVVFTTIPVVNAQSNPSLLLYENKQYGFSIKYPPDWQKQEQLSTDNTFPNIFDIVTFQSPTQLTHYGVMIMKDNTTYRGLNDQEFLDKMSKEFGDSLCISSRKSGATCTSQSIQKTTFTHQNGYAGYMTVNSLTISTDKRTIQPIMGIGMYPDGNNIWVLAVVAFSSDEATNLQNTLSTMANSFMIYNYHGTSPVSPSATSTESSFGKMKINSGVFYASKYSSDTIVVSGTVTSFSRGTPITLKITKPDGTADYQAVLVKKDGTFSSPVIVNENWKEGNYHFTATYGNNEIGSVTFQVISGTKPTSQTNISNIQNAKTLSYTNNEYGISIQYPSLLTKSEGSPVFPNGVNLVSFSTASNMTGISIELIKNDSTFSGLTNKKFLEKMKEQYESNFCKYFRENGNICTLSTNTEEGFTSRNGYVGFRAVYIIEITNPTNNSQFKMVLFPALFPVGNDIWVLTGGSYSGEEVKSLGKDLDNMLDTFTISDYHTPNLVFNSKAIQKDDTVSLVILNPSTSTNGVYSVKISSNSKITNFIKLSGWTSKRLDSKSVIYQTISSPINPSDVFKVKLKVDGKNPEIQWEVFSKDQKGISKGRATT